MGENTIYVAVHQDVRESRKTLEWTLKTFPGKKICLLLVHTPFSFTSSSSWLDENEINAIQESQVKDSYNSLYKYRDICTNKGVNEAYVDISLILGYNVGEKIVEFIYQNNITKLVMGAAADPHYSRGMSITSRKAEYVSQHAPHWCKMWFICKGKLIKTKEGSFGVGNLSNTFPGFYDSNEKPTKVRSIDKPESTEPPKVHPGEIPRTNESPNTSIESEPDSSPSPPQEFICPILQDIMIDPHQAGDGYTYEKEAIKNWLRINPTSPITRAELHDRSLVPNHTLRSLIQDWHQKYPNYTH